MQETCGPKSKDRTIVVAVATICLFPNASAFVRFRSGAERASLDFCSGRYSRVTRSIGSSVNSPSPVSNPSAHPEPRQSDRNHTRVTAVLGLYSKSILATDPWRSSRARGCALSGGRGIRTRHGHRHPSLFDGPALPYRRVRCGARVYLPPRRCLARHRKRDRAPLRR